jgi:hypothetical protein
VASLDKKKRGIRRPRALADSAIRFRAAKICPEIGGKPLWCLLPGF